MGPSAGACGHIANRRPGETRSQRCIHGEQRTARQVCFHAGSQPARYDCIVDHESEQRDRKAPYTRRGRARTGRSAVDPFEYRGPEDICTDVQASAKREVAASGADVRRRLPAPNDVAYRIDGWRRPSVLPPAESERGSRRDCSRRNARVQHTAQHGRRRTHGGIAAATRAPEAMRWHAKSHLQAHASCLRKREPAGTRHRDTRFRRRRTSDPGLDSAQRPRPKAAAPRTEASAPRRRVHFRRAPQQPPADRSPDRRTPQRNDADRAGAE